MNWKILSFGLLLLPLLIAMGIWQLGRASEKEASLALYQQLLQSPMGNWQTLNMQPLQYQRLQLTGKYLADNDWLLDNQVYQGKFGYRVFTPFCHDGNCILVDRGWVKGNLNRATLPDISSPEHTVTILGRLDKFTSNPAVGEDEPLTKPPYRVQQLNFARIKAFLQAQPGAGSDRLVKHPQVAGSLAGWILRMEDAQPGHFAVTWQPVVTGPEKHYGYAFQWFAMAVALIILLLYISLKNRQ